MVPIIIVDGLDESLAEFDSPYDIIEVLRELTSYGRLLITCRRREFEDELSAAIDIDLFDSVKVVGEWRFDVEFRDFVRRLREARLLTDESVIRRVAQSDSLQSLIRRPLFARMLTFLETGEPSDIETVDELYAEYLDRLSVAADRALRSSGCLAESPSIKLWSMASWEAFSKALFRDDSFSVSAVVAGVSTRVNEESRCVGRSLSQITDQRRVAGRIWGRFVHFSFFEYTLAYYYADEIVSALDAADPSRLLDCLALDLTPEVRHFVVGRLRGLETDGVGSLLGETYRLLSTERLTLASRRTTGNLIAYIISRVDPVAGLGALEEMQAAETDGFLRQSLLWAMCHAGSNPGVMIFFDELVGSAEHRALNRGYLMYYYGDLDRRIDPPFRDTDPAVPWARSRQAKLTFMSDGSYGEAVRPQRRAVDLYTLLDFSLFRGEVMDSHGSAVVASVLAGLYESDVPDQVLLTLHSMASAACNPSLTAVLDRPDQQRLL